MINGMELVRLFGIISTIKNTVFEIKIESQKTSDKPVVDIWNPITKEVVDRMITAAKEGREVCLRIRREEKTNV